VAHKVTALSGAIVHGPAQPQNNHLDLWWVEGELYVDLTAQPAAEALVAYWTRKGFTVATGQAIPEAYTAAVAGLREQARLHFGMRSAVATQDAEDPDRRNYVVQDL
jgi:hypothetical protein